MPGGAGGFLHPPAGEQGGRGAGEQGSRGAGEQDGEGDVEEVEPGVEGEQLAAGAQRVLGLLTPRRKWRGHRVCARLVVNGCSHFSTSLRCEGLEWNDV